MNRSLAALGLLAVLGTAPALAQTTTTGRPAPDAATSARSGSQEAVTRPNTDKPDANRPDSTQAAANARLEEGANSFTEARTRGRLEESGHEDVKDLKKDDEGIWRGAATLDGKPVSVGADFKGNVAAQ